MRSVYSRMLQALNINEGDFIITERTLRLEVPYIGGKNSYELAIVENKGSDRPLERKLNRNDGFVLSHLGFGITKQDTSVSPAQYANFPVLTFPDPNFFAGVSGGISEAGCLECSYNGDVSLKVNNTEIIQEFSLLHNRFVPERGYTLLAAPQVANEWPMYGPHMEQRGFYPYSVNAILNGQDNNTLNFQLGAGNTEQIAGLTDKDGGAVNTRNVAVFFLHGYEIAEAAQSGLRWGTF